MPLIAVSILLLIIGVVFIHSAGEQTGGVIAGFWKKQLLWICVGTVLMLVLACSDYEVLGKFSLVIFLILHALLLLVFTPFGLEVHGARSWIQLPGATLQPSEFAKIGFIIPLAWYASFKHTDFKKLSHVCIVLALTAIPICLIMLQPDMGSAMVFVPIAIAVLFLGGLRKRIIILAIVSAMIAGPLLFKYTLRTHQKERVLILIKPNLPKDAYMKIYSFSGLDVKSYKNGKIDDWNALQSLLAVGAGGVWGKGIGNGTQNALGFLPKKVAPTDFIFSVIAEEAGFAGSFVLIILFAILLFLAIYIAAKARDEFGKYLATAIAALYCTHIFINIGMTIQLMPIIGIPLPCVSYGGAVMIMTLSSVGILQSIYIHRHKQ